MTITKGGMDLENIPESPCGMAASQHIGQQAQHSDGKHTPGPWSLEPEGEWIHSQGAEEDANIVCDRPGFGPRSLARWPANARLIAAAPELLAALQVFVDHECDYMIRNKLGDPEAQQRVKLARSAIQKAVRPADGPAEGHDGLVAPG